MDGRSRSMLLVMTAGVCHAALIIGVALRFGYDVGPSAYTPGDVVWRYGGLIVLGALPVWLAVKGRLLVPLTVVAVFAGFALFMELTPPDPTFRDVAELEGVDGPTGYTVVENGLYLVKYTSAWYVWTAGAIVGGLWEHVVRTRSTWLPNPRWNILFCDDVDNALLIAAAAGGVHAAASLGYAWGGGMLDTPILVAWAVVGSVSTMAIPVYVLIRYDLSWPTAVAVVFVLNSVHSQQYAGPADPHALYVGGWFVFVGLSLVVGTVEYGLRRLRTRGHSTGE